MIVHRLIVSACAGCNKVSGDICVSYIDPSARHRVCVCPLKSVGRSEVINPKGKKINPLKASKRGSRGR